MCKYCVNCRFEDDRLEIPDHHLDEHNLHDRDLVSIIPFDQHDGEMGEGYVGTLRDGSVQFSHWRREKYDYKMKGWVLVAPVKFNVE